MRDLVFISYAHEDRKWVEYLRTFLKPYVKRGRLTVWVDDYIKVGDEWHREISAALDRTSVGVALVTQDFVASDFITDEELPRMLAAVEESDATIVAVPVSASTHELLELDRYQWARSPDDPLDDLRKPDRNKALVEITKQIVAAASHADDDITGETVRPAPAERRVAAVGSPTDRPGELFGVPEQRPHFVARDEDRQRVIDALLGEDFAVGLTGHRGVGVHGQGGIGKSVLAIDVVRHETIRESFPDGVFWLTVGQQPKLLDLQTQLLRDATGRSAAVGSPAEGHTMLLDAFASKRALLVLDDLWSSRDASAFDVLGDGCRLLMTTRDLGVVAEVGAREERLDLLARDAARALLAKWIGVDVDELPGEADELIDESGNLPLAISLAGARIADGAAPSDVLQRLREGKLYYLDHPYGSVFASMQLSVDALDPGERARLIELAVFPEDIHIPASVIARLWARSSGMSSDRSLELLTALDQKALLYLDEDEGGVSFHDLQHDYLRLSADELESVHAALIDAYYPDGADLPDIPTEERYMWDRLPYHLSEAAQHDRLRDLLLDPGWLRAKLEATDIAALLEDFAPLTHGDLGVLGATLRKSAPILGSDPSQLPGQLLGRLLDQGMERVCERVDRAAVRTWLRPQTRSLGAPGEGETFSLLGHTDWIRDVVFLPDGNAAITASTDRTLCIWDLATGQLRRRLTGHGGAVNAVAASRDGGVVVSASSDRTLRLWDPTTGEVQGVLDGHGGEITAVAVADDGDTLVSGDSDGSVAVWSIGARRLVPASPGHTEAVTAVAVGPDGRTAITGSASGTVRMWDLASAQEVGLLSGHTSGVRGIAFTQDGSRAVTASNDRTLRVWDLTGRVSLLEMNGHGGGVNDLCLHRRRNSVISVGNDRTIRVWDLDTGEPLVAWRAHTSAINAVDIDETGSHLITGSDDRTARVWELQASPPSDDSRAHTDRVNAVTVSIDGRRAVSGGQDGAIRVWDVERASAIRTLGTHEAPLHALALSRDGSRLASSGEDRSVRVWDLERGEMLVELPRPSRAVLAVGFTADERVVTAGLDHVARVWNADATRPSIQLSGHKARINALATTPDGAQIVTASNDRTLRVWDARSGRLRAVLEGHRSAVTAVALTPDGERAVSTARDKSLRVWRLHDGEQVGEIDSDAGWLNDVAVTADGRKAATAGEDHRVRLWDLGTGEELMAFTADAPIEAIAAARSGTIVAGDGAGFVHMLAAEAPGAS